MSRETAGGGSFDNLPHSDDESVDYDNDVILDDDDNITTMPVRESSDTDIYDGSASRPEAEAPENITKQGRQNEVQIAPAAPQIAQIKEQPPTMYLATTTGNGPTSTWRPSSSWPINK